MSASVRDPAALPRLGWTLVALVLLWPLLRLTDFRPAALFDDGNLNAMGHFVGGFLPMETSPDFLALLGKATLETLAMATAGIALAVLLAVPLGLTLTRSLSVSRLGPGRGGWVGQVLRSLARGDGANLPPARVGATAPMIEAAAVPPAGAVPVSEAVPAVVPEASPPPPPRGWRG